MFQSMTPRTRFSVSNRIILIRMDITPSTNVPALMVVEEVEVTEGVLLRDDKIAQNFLKLDQTTTVQSPLL